MTPERVIEVALGLYEGPRTGATAPRAMAKAVLATLARYGCRVEPSENIAATEEAIARVRAIHCPDEPPGEYEWVSGGRKPRCLGCDVGDPYLASEWPCDTIRALARPWETTS